jgi:hypothetical protein
VAYAAAAAGLLAFLSRVFLFSPAPALLREQFIERLPGAPDDLYCLLHLSRVADHSDLPGRGVQPVRLGAQVQVRGPGRRFRVGHRLRLILTSDDQDQTFPAMMTFRHASVGTSSLNRIASSSRLVLPALSSPPS